MILIYTGNGKGKTSACIGQALRALGHGLDVVFAQFIKRPGVAGEQLILSRLLGENFRAGGLGFFTNKADKLQHEKAAQDLLAWAWERPAQMLVLDEVLYALKYELLIPQALDSFLERAQNSDNHLVLSGRDSPQWLLAKAHIVTEMRQIKHAAEKGVVATPGIEY